MLTADPRLARLALAADPMPAACERGPVARLHWRHGLDVDAALASAVVDVPTAPVEYSALLAETHAALLDPAGLTPLARPSPLGRAVGDALHAAPSWQALSDAAQAHPLIARESVVALSSVVLDALQAAGAKASTDTRASLAALDAARAALERARAAAKAATTSAEKRDALRDSVAAQEATERASAAVAVDDGIAHRTEDTLGHVVGAAVARIAEEATARADAAHAFSAALGSGVGVGGAMPLSDDIVRALTPKVAAMLRTVGALRKALSAGRAARHVRGREGMVGLTTGGLEHASDLTSLALAGLGGYLGTPFATLTRLALVESRADVVEKGGGIARNGDVVVIVDKSGSMRGAREEWAGALALAVLLEARADNRTAAVITYNGGVLASIVVDSPASLAAAVVAIARTSGGDNNEHAALTEASAVLGRMPHGGDPADLLMITDGQWEASNLDGVRGLDRARLRGVFIGGAAPEGAGFASAWSIESTEGAEAGTLAVEIASTIV